MTADRRRRLAAAGATLFVLAVLWVFVPGLAGMFPTDAVVSALGSDYVVVAVLASVALCCLLAALVVRGFTGHRQATPPTPEEVQSGRLFGSEVDDAVDGVSGLRAQLLGDDLDVLRERIRAAAVRTLVETENRGRDEAVGLVDRGEWTDDPDAAAVLARADGFTPTLGERLRTLLTGRSWTQRALRRAAADVARRHGIDPGEAPGLGPDGAPGLGPDEATSIDAEGTLNPDSETQPSPDPGERR